MHRFVVRRRTGLVLLALTSWLLTADPGWGFERELEARAHELAHELEEIGVESVAVVGFSDLQGRETELGRFLAEELSGALVETGTGIRVVDRSRTAKILAEWKLSATALIDPVDPEAADAARRFRRIAGVEALVTGRLTPFLDTVHLSLLVLELETAVVLGSETADLPRTPAITELEGRSLKVACDPGSGAPMEISIDGPPSQRIETEHYAFDLYGCARNADGVLCQVMVQNLDEERNLTLSGKTWAVYGTGGQVRASRMSLGSHWATGDLSKVGTRMLEGVTVPLAVVFEGVPEGIGGFRFVALDFYGLEVRFRDVPVEP